jgi:hypothetical protein
VVTGAFAVAYVPCATNTAKNAATSNRCGHGRGELGASAEVPLPTLEPTGDRRC